MPIQQDDAGNRRVEVEVEVPGTPEDVWQAIASGPGISAWFVPSEVDGRVGGSTTSSFGPGMDSLATITAWDPPRSFAAESADLGPESPTVATAWIVEARDGGRCVVRVVHTLRTTADRWDGALEAWEGGWPGFFRILRLYLTHFSGQPHAAFQVMGVAPEPEAAAWGAFTASLGLTDTATGARVRTPDDAPTLGGRIEQASDGDGRNERLLVLDAPAPGIAHLFAMPMGGQVLLSVRYYLYGADAAAAVADAEAAWRDWLAARFALAGANAEAAG